MKIETESTFPGLVHLRFDTQYQLASSFIRIQEFYESCFDEFRRKYFTLDDCMDKYAEVNNNIFSYFEDWSGFNVPGDVFEKFFKLFNKDLRYKEQIIYEHVRDELVYARGNINYDSFPTNYYVIASCKDDVDQRGVIDHEIAHGLYYLVPEYREEMNAITTRVPDSFKKALSESHYTDEVLDDELQAYFATSTMESLVIYFEDCERFPWDDILECKTVFRKHYKRQVGKEAPSWER